MVESAVVGVSCAHKQFLSLSSSLFRSERPTTNWFGGRTPDIVDRKAIGWDGWVNGQ